MPFCHSCGSEIKPGKKFCTRCGAAVVKSLTHPPIPPPNSQTPPVEPSALPETATTETGPVTSLPQLKPAPFQDKRIIVGVIGAIILAIIILVGILLIQSQNNNSNSQIISSPSLSTAFPIAVKTTYPYSTVLPSQTITTPSVITSSNPTVYRNGIPYIQVFSHQYGRPMAPDIFTYTLVEPPLLIECEMNPAVVTRDKLVDIGTTNERYITTVYPDPSAWLDLKLINSDTDTVIETIRFSKNYMGSTQQDYTIRAPGNYRFEIDGGQVSPTVRLLIKK